MEWALAGLSNAESFDDYARRWETVRALIREGGHNLAVRRMLEIEGIRTYSEGDDPDRRVIIAPKLAS